LLILVAAVAAVILVPCPAGAGSSTTVPNFVLKDLNGKDVSLADLRAKGPVLVDFWATWCKPCLREMPHLEALHKDYAARGLQVVAITVDDTRSIAKAKSYVKTHGYTFTVLFDPNQRTLRDLQGVTCPYVVLISAEGERLYTHSGYRDGDEKELRKEVAELLGDSGEAGDDAGREPAPAAPAGEAAPRPAPDAAPAGDPAPEEGTGSGSGGDSGR
jgi:thiol-disulfide isomerase/thioredoxin